MNQTVVAAAAAAALALLAGCQSQPAVAPAASAAVAPEANLIAALEGRSLLFVEEGAVLSCTYLDPALHGYSFDDPADIDRFVAWRVEGDDRLCTYNGAVMDCWRVSSVAPDRTFLTPDGTDTALIYELAEGDQCG